MPQKNENITKNDENQVEDQTPFDEEELDAAELYGTIRTIYDKNGRAIGTECFL